jgi:3-oxoacyl-[acyl-carrier-protein] synthase I
MAAPDVVVVSVGMVTSVGLSARETAASVRAATMGFGTIDWLDHRFEPFTVAVVPEEGLPDLAPDLYGTPHLRTRDARLLRLGGAALAECLGSFALLGDKPPLALALPETERVPPVDAGRFLNLFSAQVGGAFDPAMSVTLSLGRAGGLVALGRAAELIRSGKSRFAIAGALDSYIDLYTLGTLDSEMRVKSGAHLDGFIPGEGAAFVLLAAQPTAARAALPSLAIVSAAAEGFEKGHLGSKAPYLGEGLAVTIRTLIRTTPPIKRFVSVWSSMNGESYWAKEWGVAFLRSRDSFDDSLATNHPADCFGDTGAAAGLLLAGLASLDCDRGAALVYSSSDGGQRASVSILPTG